METPTQVQDTSPSGCRIVDGSPEFYGPWKTEFEGAYNRTANELAKQILCSDEITSEDIAALNAVYASCLAEVGITDVEFDDYGGLKITTGPEISDSFLDRRVELCEDETGWGQVIPVVYESRQNPNKMDLDQLIADCLVRVGLESPGFSGTDVDAEYSGDGIPFEHITDRQLLNSCLHNPLGTG